MPAQSREKTAAETAVLAPAPSRVPPSQSLQLYDRRSHTRANGAAATRPHRSLYFTVARIADTLGAAVALVSVFVLTNADEMPDGLHEFLLLRISVKNLLVFAAFVLFWRALFDLAGMYDSSARRSWAGEVRRVLLLCTIGSAATLLLPLVSRTDSFELAATGLIWVATVAVSLGTRLSLRSMNGNAETSGTRNIIIVGSGPRAQRLYAEIQASPANRQVLGFVDSFDRTPEAEIARKLLGGLPDLQRILMTTVVDEVIIALPVKSRYAEIQQAILDCERSGVESRYLANVFNCSIANPRFDNSVESGAVALPVVADDYRLIIKRGIDIVGATVGLIVAAPLMLLIALAIKLTSPGPVIFTQERYGYRKRVFRMYKFRTMVDGANEMQRELEAHNEASGPVFKIRQDPRITWIGKFLRRTSMDELPQLWNVLRGEMSLVGPRPLPDRDVRHFSEAWLMRRFSTLPGLTCLWQVSGRSSLGFDDWIALDLRYIDEWSLSLDFRILLRTLPAVIRGSGAT